MKTRFIPLWLLLCGVTASAPPARCAPPTSALCAASPALRAELDRAATTGIANPMNTEAALAPFRALRARHPGDLFAQEAYQDAVQQYGVEGNLKALAEEYQALDRQHDGDPMYHYLYFRSLVGYSTGAALQGLTEMTTEAPGFAPAHQTLAAIYACATFRDDVKEKSEQAKLFALCPKAVPDRLPSPLPGPSQLLDQAEKLLAQNGDPARILAMAAEGISQDEWRWQHIHPHDWYSDDEKRAALRGLRASYWQEWAIQVRCARHQGQPAKADALLARMDRSASSFQSESGHAYRDALATLVRLYAEGGQKEQASQTLGLMTALPAEKPDPSGEAQVKALKALIVGSDNKK